MLIELLNQKNYISFNIKTAQIFGLNTAVYLSELIAVYDKAKDKSKLVDNNYFKLDRKYVFVRTTLSLEEQLRIDAKLMTVGIISKHKDNPDTLKIDLKLYASIVSSDDVELLEDLAKRLGTVDKKSSKESKRQIIIKNLKDSIKVSNYELLTALRDWVDAIYASPKGNYLSNQAVKLFVDTLLAYSKDDMEVALSLVQIATIQGYRDCSWAINVHERDKKFKKDADSKLPRVTTQKKATTDTLSDEVF